MTGLIIIGVAFALSFAFTAYNLISFYLKQRRWIALGTTGIKQAGISLPELEIYAGTAAFERTFVAEFGPSLRMQKPMQNLRIEWFKGTFFYSPPGSERKAAGDNPDWQTIRLADMNSSRLEDTAFFHELIHVALRATKGGPDYDHEGPVYSGWTEKHTALVRRLKKEHAEARAKDGLASYSPKG